MTEAEPRNSKNCQQIPKARGGKEGFSPTRLRCLPTPWFQTSTPQNCEGITFCYLRHPLVVLCYMAEISSVQFSCSVMSDSLGPHGLQHARLPCPSPTPGAQTCVHRVSDAIQPSHPLSYLSPPAFNLSQHKGLFKGVSSLHQVAKILELQLQHQSIQWIFRTDFP